MTRETKIGLLVGLAFIIVIGILLSDHLTSATEPPQAQLAQVGNNVRSSTAAPGANRAAQPVVNNTVQQPAGPQHAVPTQNELANRGAQPVQIINVGGPASTDNNTGTTLQASNPPVTMQQPQDNNQGNAPVIVNNQGGNLQQEPVRPNPPSNDPIVNLARQHGEELVGPNGQPLNNGGNTAPQNPPVVPANTTSYVAQPGDSVSKLAAKFLGANNKANREAIINANPSLKEDANKIIVGKPYTIPGKVASQTKPEASAPAHQDAPSQDRQAQKPPTTASQDHWYTVQAGDSLWKIASTQCGDSKAIAAIKELNKDIIKNDTVQAGQKIRLPNAPK